MRQLIKQVTPQKSNQFGIAPIIIVILIAIIGGSSVLVFKNLPSKQIDQPSVIEEATSSAEAAKEQIEPIPAETKAPATFISPTPKPAAKVTTPSPSTQPKIVTLSGFAYEDRNNDGIFNSDDPKIKYMQFLIYDSSTNEWINTVYSEEGGGFSVTNTVKGSLVFKPTCNDNFCPKEGAKTFSVSASNLQYAFRSASAPTGENNGVIEGDVIIEKDRQYKFYLMDRDNNYYSGETTGGHFKYQNLHNNKTYVIRISYGDGNPQDMEITLTPSSPEQKTIQVRIK